MALDDQAKTYTEDDLEELDVQARGAILARIAEFAGNTNSALVLQRLGEAYAYVTAPDNAHGTIG